MELPFDKYGNPRLFPPDTHVLSNHAEYRQAAEDPAIESFVRTIFLGYGPPLHLGLVELLKQAETQRQHLAKLCGALAIDVEFGFIGTNLEDDIQFDDGQIIPPGVRLVGRVPVIRNFVCFDNEDFDCSNPAYKQAREGILQYRSEFRPGGYYAVDAARLDQFGLCDDGTILLIDADPVLSIK